MYVLCVYVCYTYNSDKGLLFLSQLGAKCLKYLNCLHDLFVTSTAVTAADCVDTETLWNQQAKLQ